MENYSHRPALSSRIRGKSCIGTLGKWRLLFDVQKVKHSSLYRLCRRSVGFKVPKLKAMNYGELDREDFGFSVAEGSIARPLCRRRDQKATREW